MRDSRNILVLGVLLGTATSTAALAQQGHGTPVTLVCSEKEPNPCSTVILGLRAGVKDSTGYVSLVHTAALGGITFPDDAARRSFRAALFRQIDGIDRDIRQALADKKANATLRDDLFATLLPELRELIPTDQREAFDQNVKTLRESAEPLTVIRIDRSQAQVRTDYIGFVWSVVFRGMSFAQGDAARVGKVLERQAAEVARKSGKGVQPAKPMDDVARHESEVMRQRQKELVDQRLPELRALIPAGQQVTFDQNVKALRESDYTIMLDLRASTPREADEVPAGYLIACVVGCS